MPSPKTDLLKNLTIQKIEEEKEERTKNLYAFNLTLTKDQELLFNQELKQLINNISNLDSKDRKDKEIVGLKHTIDTLKQQISKFKRKSGIIDKIIKKIKLKVEN